MRLKQVKYSFRQSALFFFCFVLVLGACSSTPEVKQQRPDSRPADMTWRRLGPGGGGAMFLPTVNPADPENVFLRCDMTGAYVTHDGGKSWRMFHLRTVVRDFEFDPSDPDVIYASNTGLYRSDDGGVSWKLIYPDPASIVAERMVGDHAEQFFVTGEGEMRGEIVKVRVDPGDGNHIYIGLTPPYESTPADGKQTTKNGAPVMVTIDRGNSWHELARVTGSTVLAIVPGSWDGLSDELTVVTDNTIARITESTGEIDEYPLPGTRAAHAAAGVEPDGSVIYLLISSSLTPGYLPSGEEIFRSDDRGRSWKRIMGGLLEDAEVSGKTPVFSTIAVCENDPEVAYLSCNRYYQGREGTRQFGIFKTTDSGESWCWVFRAEFDSMISGNYDGGWLMEEYGPEWGENPFSIGVSPSNPDIAYASDFGCTHRTTDGGKTWEQVYTDRQPDGSWVSRGLDVTVCYGVQFDPFDKDHLFANYTDIGALQSFNGGESWTHATDGIPHAWINGCYWTVFDPAVKNRAWSVWSAAHDLPRPKMFRSGNFDRYAGGAAVSNDGCRSWQVSNAGLPENCPSTHIVLDENSPVESRTLYLCGFGKGVFKSVDGGANWSKCGEIPGPNKNAWQLALLPGGLLLTENGGKNWQRVFREDAHVFSVAVDPDDLSRVYINTFDSAAFTSADGGRSWNRIQGYDFKWGHRVIPDPHKPGMIYLTAFGGGLFHGPGDGDPQAKPDIVNFSQDWRWGL